MFITALRGGSHVLARLYHNLDHNIHSRERPQGLQDDGVVRQSGLHVVLLLHRAFLHFNALYSVEPKWFFRSVFLASPRPLDFSAESIEETDYLRCDNVNDLEYSSDIRVSRRPLSWLARRATEFDSPRFDLMARP